MAIGSSCSKLAELIVLHAMRVSPCVLANSGKGEFKLLKTSRVHNAACDGSVTYQVY